MITTLAIIYVELETLSNNNNIIITILMITYILYIIYTHTMEEVEGGRLKGSNKNARVLTMQVPSETRRISQLQKECLSKPSLVLSCDCLLCGWDVPSVTGRQVPLHWVRIPPGSQQQVGQASLASPRLLPLRYLLGRARMFALSAVTQSGLLPTPRSEHS